MIARLGKEDNNSNKKKATEKVQKFKAKSEIKLSTILTYLLPLSFLGVPSTLLFFLFLPFVFFPDFSFEYLLPFHGLCISILPSVPISVLAPLLHTHSLFSLLIPVISSCFFFTPIFPCPPDTTPHPCSALLIFQLFFSVSSHFSYFSFSGLSFCSLPHSEFSFFIVLYRVLIACLTFSSSFCLLSSIYLLYFSTNPLCFYSLCPTVLYH